MAELRTDTASRESRGAGHNLAVIAWLLGLPRPLKRLIALGMDSAMCVLSVYVAFYLRLGVWVDIRADPAHPILGSIAMALPVFVSFGLYRAVFRYAGWSAIVTVGRAITVYAIPFIAVYTVIGIYGVPRTIGIIQPILLFLFIASSRVFTGAYLGDTYRALWRNSELPLVLVYGAGTAGRQLATAIQASDEMRLAGFIDDDPSLWGATINGSRVYSPQELPRVTERRRVTEVLLAIPSAGRARRAEILASLRQMHLHVLTVPGLMDVARGHVSVSDLREVEIEDLLGRDPVPPNPELLQRNISGKIVLITGAGGSIGSELARQIVTQKPARLLLLDASEYNLYAIHQELAGRTVALGLEPEQIVPLLGSVCDPERIAAIFAAWRPQSVFHAAAYKHVPLVEHNLFEGIRNNAFGTRLVAETALRTGTENFVLISTDKAVRPTNVMGATKRLAELVLQALQLESKGTTTFSMVRFGNVLGSSGSVVPLFREQIRRGGPVTITDPEMTRYFMTIPEASQLVIQAGAMGLGGDVFLLDMGDPVRIMDLARNIIELSGQTVRDADNPNGDIAIEVTGLRPGEKLYEELLIGAEPCSTEHSRIMRSHEPHLAWAELRPGLDALTALMAEHDAAGAKAKLAELVREYASTTPLVDWVATQIAERRDEIGSLAAE